MAPIFSRALLVFEKTLQDQARKAFAKSELGALTRELHAATRGSGLTPRTVQQFGRRLSKFANRNVADKLLSELVGGDLVREARALGVPARSFFEGAGGVFGAIGKLVKSLSNPSIRGTAVPVDRELQAAAAFVRASGGVVVPKSGLTIAEQRRVAAFLRANGWRVEEPQGLQPARNEARPGRTRKTVDVDTGNARQKRVSKTDELATGAWIRVQSSNVYAIKFALDESSSRGFGASTGDLLIQFLAEGSKGKRSGPGAIYRYYGVPVAVFEAFRRANSAGRFVWDNVRTRGTLTGHRYPFDLDALGPRGNVPRQVGLKRGQQGEFFLKRKFRDSAGRLVESQLPEKRVRSSSPADYQRHRFSNTGPNRFGP